MGNKVFTYSYRIGPLLKLVISYKRKSSNYEVDKIDNILSK